MRLSDMNYWTVLAIISGILTLIVALGEWVFHWWREPGEALSVVGLLATLLLAGFSDAKSDGRRMESHLATISSHMARSLALQERMLERQERMSQQLDRMSEQLDRVSQQLERIQATTDRHTPMLEEAVRFFRRPPAGA